MASALSESRCILVAAWRHRLTRAAGAADTAAAMTTNEMLVFCGRVLGPALVARDVAQVLRHVPALAPKQPVDLSRADQLLQQVFPEGVEL